MGLVPSQDFIATHNFYGITLVVSGPDDHVVEAVIVVPSIFPRSSHAHLGVDVGSAWARKLREGTPEAAQPPNGK